MKKYITTFLFILPLLLANHVFATTVETQVNTSFSTGGNRVINGESVEGSSKSSVKVYTEVDGEVIEDFEKEFEGETQFEFETEKETLNSKVKTEIKVEGSVPEVEVSFVRKILNYVLSIFKF